MRLQIVFVAALVFTFTLTGFAEAATPGIPGAAGSIEYWHPLGSSPRAGVLFIVTHDSWGPPGSGRSMARSQSGGRVGVEWWVLSDGSIIHSDRERITGHCGDNPAPGVSRDCNKLSVGIEFEGYGRVTEPQVRSGLALIRFLQERYCIKSEDIAAHRKAGNGSEGVAMMQAARNLGYSPDCNGAVRGDISDDVVATAVRDSRNLLAPSVLDTNAQRSPLYSPSAYPQQALPGSQQILGQSYTTPSSGNLNPQSIPAFNALNQYAYPDHLEGEGDDRTQEEAKLTPQLKNTDSIVVLKSGTSSPSVVSLGAHLASQTISTSSPQRNSATTFVSPDLNTTRPVEPLPLPQNIFMQIASILSRILGILRAQ